MFLEKIKVFVRSVEIVCVVVFLMFLVLCSFVLSFLFDVLVLCSFVLSFVLSFVCDTK